MICREIGLLSELKWCYETQIEFFEQSGDPKRADEVRAKLAELEENGERN